jgi:hypothetical protein
VHKDFYASGFVYHPKSQQILLRQQSPANETSSWELFGKQSKNGKTGEEVFLELFSKELKLKLKLNKINAIYSYFSKEMDINHNIYYAEVSKLNIFSNSGKTKYSWFTFRQIQKIKLSEQVRHDLMVGQRVINSNIRKTLGERTIG